MIHAAAAIRQETQPGPRLPARSLGNYTQAPLLPIHLAPNDLPPSAEGRLYHNLLDEGWTKARIKKYHGAGHPRIANRLAIHQLPPEVQAMYDDGRLPLMSAGHLLAIPGENDRLTLARLLAGRDLPLARVEALAALVARGGIDALLGQTPAPAAANGNGANGASAGTGCLPAHVALAGERIGLAVIQAAVVSVCKTCDAVPVVKLPPTLPGSDIDAAAGKVCDACFVRDLAGACDQCPLVEFLATLANQTERTAT